MKYFSAFQEIVRRYLNFGKQTKATDRGYPDSIISGWVDGYDVISDRNITFALASMTLPSINSEQKVIKVTLYISKDLMNSFPKKGNISVCVSGFIEDKDKLMLKVRKIIPTGLIHELITYNLDEQEIAKEVKNPPSQDTFDHEGNHSVVHPQGELAFHAHDLTPEHPEFSPINEYADGEHLNFAFLEIEDDANMMPVTEMDIAMR